jgi:HEAT repeat protein
MRAFGTVVISLSAAVGAAPAADGPTLADWIRDLSSEHPVERANAVEYLSVAGGGRPAVVAALAGLLRDRDAGIRRRALTALSRLGLFAYPAAAEIGAAALSDPSVELRLAAIDCLVEAGPATAPALEPLIRCTQATDARIRAAATRALAAVGPAARTAAAALVGLLGDADASVRAGAACGLGRIAPQGAEVVVALRRAAADADATVRAAAIDALGRLGPPAAEATADLERAAADADDLVRAEAVGALWRIRRDAGATVTRLLEYETGAVGKPASAAGRRRLALLAEVGAAAAPDLSAALRSDRPGPRAAAIRLLCAVRSPALAAAMQSELIRLLAGDDDAVVADVAGLLDSARVRLRPSVPALIELLRRGGPAQRAIAARLLGGAGGAATPAALIAALDDRDSDVRGAAIAALGEYGPRAGAAVAKLIDMTADPGPVAGVGRMRGAAFAAVGELAAAIWPTLGSPAAPHLAVRLRHPEAEVRATAAQALVRMGVDGEAALAALLRAAGDEADPDVRFGCLEAAAAVGPGSPAVVAALVKALEDPRLAVGSATLLAAMGPPARGAGPALRRLIRARGDGGMGADLDALAAVGDPEAVPLLAAALEVHARRLARNPRYPDDVEGDALCSVLERLAGFGAGAAASAPAVRALLKSRHHRVRLNAIAALCRIDATSADGPAAAADAIRFTVAADKGPDDGAIPDELLHEQAPRLAQAAAQPRTGAPTGSPAALIAGLDGPLHLRRACCAALALSGPAAAPAAGRLRLMLLDAAVPDFDREAFGGMQPRLWAALALARIEGRSDAGAAVLLDVVRAGLDAGTYGDRRDDEEALAAAARAAEAAVELKLPEMLPLLNEMLAHERVELRRPAPALLVRAGAAADRALAALIERLDDADAVVRREAAIALGALGQPAEAAVPALEAAARDGFDPALRRAAAEALRRVRGL